MNLFEKQVEKQFVCLWMCYNVYCYIQQENPKRTNNDDMKMWQLTALTILMLDSM